MWRAMGIAVAVATGIALSFPASCLSGDGDKISLTGKWSINFRGGGTYYLRQVGDEVWWVGESPDGGKSWTNIGHGRLAGRELTVRWADSPRGSAANLGTVTLRLVIKDGEVTELRKTKQAGAGFGGDTLKRLKEGG